MSEKNEKQKPSKKSELPQSPKIEISETEADLNLLKEEIPAPPLDAFLAEQEIVPEEEPVDETPELTFKKPIDESERKHYEVILKANREAIRDLRKQVQLGLAKIDALTAELETKELEG